MQGWGWVGHVEVGWGESCKVGWVIQGWHGSYGVGGVGHTGVGWVIQGWVGWIIHGWGVQGLGRS